jgi:L-ascorbate metabolism protein UlaG (beta-lactamase superfamily)
MRFTKFPQSCAVIEEPDGGRLLIDPGNVAMDAVAFDAFGSLDAVLFTHRHPDHFDPRALEAILERDLPIFTNADVCGLIDDGATQVHDGQPFQAAGFDIVPRDLPHVVLVNGAAGPPNTAYVIDGRLLHPGDAIEVNGVNVDAVAVPVAGPSISFRDAYVMLQRTGASTAIPIHYDTFSANTALFEKFVDIATVVVLDHGEWVDL